MAQANGLTNGHAAASSWQDRHELPSHFIGGNRLEVAPQSSVKDFVEKHDGHSVITSVSLGSQQSSGEC